jgi:hypothetical protein
MRDIWNGGGDPGLLFSEVRQGIRIPQGMPTSNGDLYSIIDGRYHYIRRTDNDGEELYDHVADGGETIDLATTDGADATLEMMRAALRRHLAGSRPSLTASAR